MQNSPISLDTSFVPEEPVHPDAAAFLAQVSGMLDGRPKDEAQVEAALSRWDGLLDKVAAETYRIGSMLIGEGEEAISLIERTVSELDLSACSDHAEARHQARLILAAGAIDILRRRNEAVHPSPLAAPGPDGTADSPVSCIEDDDLSAAGVSPVELEQMLTGSDNHRLRDWLESLPLAQRVIFVLRAIAGLNSGEVAGLLGQHGGEEAQNWTPDAVRSSFRQALCSLATQLLHASAAK
jgi:hypothetical protein